MDEINKKAVAVVGMGAIMPDALDATAFWNNLVTGRYSIREVPPERWDPALYYDADPKAPNKTYSKIGSWVSSFVFDPVKWGIPIPPRVVAAMDPAQQWAIAASYQALKDFGYPDRPLNTERVAVILGNALAGEYHYISSLRIRTPFYMQALAAVPEFDSLPEPVKQLILKGLQAEVNRQIPEITEDSMPGELSNIIAGRVANVFNFSGPNFVTDAACASSFAAIQAAVHGLRAGEFDAVLTGGVDRNMGVEGFVKFCKIGALSPDGSRPYSEGANGFVMGEGAGVFLLKRLEDAEKDGDKVYGVIRGIGGSSDGKGKGITAPNPLGQQRAIVRAWQDAGLSPADATYIEGHGTSTRVGDAAEVDSMVRVLDGLNVSPDQIVLGSVKSNIGHLKSAAGAAGLFKAIHSLHNSIIAPTLNFDRPNPLLNFGRIPLFVNRELRPWNRPNGGWRRAGVSSFGFGGTNFHVVVEEYVPGLLTSTSRTFPAASFKIETAAVSANAFAANAVAANAVAAQTPVFAEMVVSSVTPPAVPRGLFFVSADTPEIIQQQLALALQSAAAQSAPDGQMPPSVHPDQTALEKPERLVVDYENQDDLIKKLTKAQKAYLDANDHAWRMLSAQGIFRGKGRPGKIAFMFPGQGCQYVNMLRELADRYPVVADTYREADVVMEPLLGRKLTDYIYADGSEEMIKQAEAALRDTTITQPAVLTADVAMMRLMGAFGFSCEYVIGHSLGEYAALVMAGVLTFPEALQVVSARGKEMIKVSLDDNGAMAAVSAPIERVQKVLDTVDGYVVIANVNAPSQSVIAGNSAPLEQAIQLCKEQGWEAVRIPVSHAFHTHVVGAASGPLRQVIARMHIKPPRIPVIANVTGEPYPAEREAIMDLMARQLASPVQFVKSMSRLYDEGVRIYVEVGPKRVISALASDNLKGKEDVNILYTNHPRKGAIPALNEALCALYAAGVVPNMHAVSSAPISVSATTQPAHHKLHAAVVEDGRLPMTGSVVISGAGLGLPGKSGNVFADDNVERILNGEIFIETLPESERYKMLAKRVTRLEKKASGAEMVLIDDLDRTIKLAGQRGNFDLSAEFGIPKDRTEALDITTQLAIAAGIEALRDAGIPLVMRYKQASTGRLLPDRWMLPEALADETGVIFSSAFPGLSRMAEETGRYHAYTNLVEQIELLKQVRAAVHSSQTDLLNDLDARIASLAQQLAATDYHFDRRFIFRILNMGHSQFAEYIGARGPNTSVNAACASNTQAVALAEDWIRNGRCRRVIVVAGDDITSSPLSEWVGTGLLATGATTIEGDIENAVLPFDRRRNGLIMGMGAAALVLEAEDAVRERGMTGICEVLASQVANSAFHGTRLDVDHVSRVMGNLLAQVEERFGLDRHAMAEKTLFMSHETYTPARGGSAAAEIHALRRTFGEHGNQVVICNTKGFTGHTMGVGIEDVVAAKALQFGHIPPIANIGNGFQPDPDLGDLKLSHGGEYPVEYALRLAAGFGSQIAMLMLRKIPGDAARVQKEIYEPWLNSLAGAASAELEVVQRTLRIKDAGAPQLPRRVSTWQIGSGPVMWADSLDEGSVSQELQPTMSVTAVPEISPEPAVVLPTPVPAVPVSASISEVADLENIKNHLLKLVSEKTGYPTEMLDMELELEADLGVDTVKQAELFVQIREHYGIPRREDLRLSDYNTLAKVVQFVTDALEVQSSAQPVRVAQTASAPEPVLPEPAVKIAEAQALTPVSTADEEIKSHLLGLVSEKTGYPIEMLDLELDLEADLGVDTVKQAELFVQIREHYSIPRREDLRLSDYNTLAKVIDFVHVSLAGLAQHSPKPAVEQPVVVQQPENIAAAVVVPAQAVQTRTLAAGSPTDEEIRQFVTALVAEKTGYPVEMLDPELDLEADLGVDTVKQAEMFALIREKYHIARREDLRLSDYSTLDKVFGFVKDALAEKAAPVVESVPQVVEPAPAVIAEPAETQASQPVVAPEKPAPQTSKDSISYPRRIPVPVLRPRLDLCKPTGILMNPGVRFVVVGCQGTAADSLVRRLRSRKAEVLLLDPFTAGSEEKVRTFQSEAPVQGIFYLPGLDEELPLAEMDPQAWQSALDVRVRYLFRLMQILDGDVPLISATRMGGLHGYGGAAPTAPLGAAVAGFTKAYAWEHRGTLVKVIDFPSNMSDKNIAGMLLEEALHDGGAVEIGCVGDQRFAISMMEQALDPQEQTALEPGSVFLVTGGAGGICVPIVLDLAGSLPATFYLTGRTPLPDFNNPDLDHVQSNPDGLKLELLKRHAENGKKATPASIDKEIAGLERAAAIRTVVQGVEKAGGTAHYVLCDVTDAGAVDSLIQQIIEKENRLDVVIHAAGVEKSHLLKQKSTGEFEQVFTVKTDGFFNLFKALQKSGRMPVAFVNFSSIAGRLGNAGQTDYSAANDLLCKLGLALGERFPQTRFLSIDWGAWAEVGMASRGSVPAVMERAGIEMMQPDEAARQVRFELQHGSQGEVIHAGKLGILQKSRDKEGGLDLGLVNQALRAGKPMHAMLSNVTGLNLYDGIRLEVELDPKSEPFLHDHAMNGVPVLPGVMGIEGFSLAATHIASVVGASKLGYHVSELEDVHFHAAFKFYRDEPRLVTWLAQVYHTAGGLKANVILQSTLLHPVRPAEKVLHFSGIVHLQPNEISNLPVVGVPPVWKDIFTINRDQIYQLYFHGPSFQVLDGVQRDGDMILGRLARGLTPIADNQQSMLTAPLLIELCFQTAGMWDMGRWGTLSLPGSIEQVKIHNTHTNGGRVYAQVSPAACEERGCFDARVMDDKGNIYIELTNYRTTDLPYGMDEEMLVPLRKLVE